MAENKMQMPGVFGGLMRYDSEYKSRFMFSPTTVVAFLVIIILLVLILKMFWPVSIPSAGSVVNVPVPGGNGFWIGLLKGVLEF
tara:strand:- start:399 stop:650 length:252 start_codon:yes stop_codon:yes gene_type:complete